MTTTRNPLPLALSVLGLLTLSGCSGGSAPTGKNLRSTFPEYRVGNRWRWQVKAPGEAAQVQVQTVASTETDGGLTFYRVERAPDGGTRTEADLLGLTDDRLLQFGFETYDAAGGLEDSVRYPTPWGVGIDLEPGRTSTQTFTLNDDLLGTPVVSTFRINIRHAGTERVTVPAGTFQAVRMEVTTTVRVRVGTEDQPEEVARTTEWRVEGVGPVKSRADDGTVEELVDADVNGVRF